MTSGRWTASARLAEHALASSLEVLPAPAAAAVKAFTLDTLGVGIAGAGSTYAAAVLQACSGWGAGAGAGVWRPGGPRLPPANAAFVNAFQAHCQEFDCVHEAAVLHPFTVVTPVLLAHAEAQQTAGGLSGADFMAACAAGVDVAVALGVAATTQIRFFRPATCGLFGATAALARARRLNLEQTVDAFGYALAFASGTMQAHVEGTPALALQVANAAKSAFQAVDLAALGLPGPKGAIDGPFGYLALFEERHDLARALDAMSLGRGAAETAWKPHPTGRAAHGGIDMALELRAQAGETAVARIEIEATPLIAHLVGRPIRAPLEVNYARLCLPYGVAAAWLRGRVDLESFTADALADPATHALAERVSVVALDHADPAAFTPQSMRVHLDDGRTLETRREILPGAPARPLSAERQREKLMGNLAFGRGPAHDPALAAPLIAACAELPSLADVGLLARLAAMEGPRA